MTQRHFLLLLHYILHLHIYFLSLLYLLYKPTGQSKIKRICVAGLVWVAKSVLSRVWVAFNWQKTDFILISRVTFTSREKTREEKWLSVCFGPALVSKKQTGKISTLGYRISATACIGQILLAFSESASNFQQDDIGHISQLHNDLGSIPS